MLLYRVFPHNPSAAVGAPGHSGYLHRPQGKGRWDNPSLYDTWYFSKSPEGAIAESFGNLATWSPEMFLTPFLAAGQRVLGVYSVPDDLSILDLDDAKNLLTLGMRPSQVVARNLAYTQSRAAEIFAARGSSGRQWAGLSWWSFHRPTLTNVALWATSSEPAPLTHVDVIPLTLSTTSMVEVARMLAKPLP